MSMPMLVRAYNSKQVSRILIFTNNRIYDGELADYPDGQKAVTTDSIHLTNVKIYSALNQELGEYPAITICASEVEAYSL